MTTACAAPRTHREQALNVATPHGCAQACRACPGTAREHDKVAEWVPSRLEALRRHALVLSRVGHADFRVLSSVVVVLPTLVWKGTLRLIRVQPVRLDAIPVLRLGECLSQQAAVATYAEGCVLQVAFGDSVEDKVTRRRIERVVQIVAVLDDLGLGLPRNMQHKCTEHDEHDVRACVGGSH